MSTPTQPSPATPAYVTETLALLGERDPIAVMQETPDWILERIGPLDIAVMRIPEGPGKWSLTQVLAHLADTEIAFGWRARLVLTQDNAPLSGFDESAWMTRFDGAGADPTAALLAFSTLRAWNLRVWESATSPSDLARIGLHSQRGPETFDRLRRMCAGHDLRHRRQIERILSAAK